MARTHSVDVQFPTERCDIESVRYWRESPTRLAQRWYIQLCIFASSAHDHFLACEEAARGNKAWSATISYYSIMHACRGLLFQCFGDFPMFHSPMVRLLSFDSGNPDSNFSFDWLPDFSRRPQNESPSRRVRKGAVRQMLRTYYRETLRAPHVSDSLERFGPLVGKAKTLREKSNYAELLIANERDHFLVPRSLAALCEHLSELARVAVDTARDALVAGLRCDPDIEDERPRIESSVKEFIDARFKRCIAEKLSGKTAESFSSWLGETELPTGEGTAETIWRDVNYQLFEEKQALMDDYASRIQRFGECVGSIADSHQRQAEFSFNEESGE